MSDTQKLASLLEAAERMRKLQNAFFNEKNTQNKNDLMRRAKEREREFDKLIFLYRQTSMFNL